MNGMPMQQQPPPMQQAQAPAAQNQGPLLRIRAGIEAGNVAEVQAGVQEADAIGLVMAPSVRDMITQWLAAHAAPANASAPQSGSAPPPAAAPAPVAAAPPSGDPEPPQPQDTGKRKSSEDDEGVQVGSGTGAWSSEAREPDTVREKSSGFTPEVLRTALLRFFEGAPKGSDAAAGLGITEGEEGARYFPLVMLGRATGQSGTDIEVYEKVWKCIHQAPPGVFSLSPDGRGCGLSEWAGWEAYSTALAAIAAATRDPAFEPRSIQAHVAKAALGAVKSGPVRQIDVIKGMQEQLSPKALPEDAAPALRSAISRRTRLALACLVDAVASAGLGAEAGPDSMGLVGQLPRAVFGLIFDNVDDRDRGACAFLGEVVQSWEKRRCFSKRWLQDAASKFSAPKGPNSERDEARGWYALTAENLMKKGPVSLEQDEKAPAAAPAEASDAKEERPPEKSSRKERADEKDKSRRRDREDRDRDRRSRSRSPRQKEKSSREETRGDRDRDRDRSPKKSASGREGGRKSSTSAKGGEHTTDDRGADAGSAGNEGSAPEGGRGGGDGKVDKLANRKKRKMQEDSDDDENVAAQLEESRKRRAALLAKHNKGDLVQ